jgi:hypothetical protein
MASAVGTTLKIAFLCNPHPRETVLCAAMRRGMAIHGDRLKKVDYDDQPRDLDCDLLAFIGVKCREWHDWCRETGQRFLYLDKGYYYPEEKTYLNGKPVVQCWRVAVDTNQPLEYLAAARHDPRRWDKFAIRPEAWRARTTTGQVIIAGSSPKFHQFHDLPHPTMWAQEVVAELRNHTDRPIHYRPKPSWWIRSPEDAMPIDGAEFVPEGSFESHLDGAHAVVTYSSNAALIAMLSGVPSVILGNGVMRLISSTDLSEIEHPRLAGEDERLQLLANLAYSQFSLAEFQNGMAWTHIKQQMV